MMDCNNCDEESDGYCTRYEEACEVCMKKCLEVETGN